MAIGIVVTALLTCMARSWKETVLLAQHRGHKPQICCRAMALAGAARSCSHPSMPIPGLHFTPQADLSCVLSKHDVQSCRLSFMMPVGFQICMPPGGPE